MDGKTVLIFTGVVSSLSLVMFLQAVVASKLVATGLGIETDSCEWCVDLATRFSLSGNEHVLGMNWEIFVGIVLVIFVLSSSGL